MLQNKLLKYNLQWFAETRYVLCCHLQDVAAVLDCAITEVVDSGVSEVAHTCASFVAAALV